MERMCVVTNWGLRRMKRVIWLMFWRLRLLSLLARERRMTERVLLISVCFFWFFYLKWKWLIDDLVIGGGEVLQTLPPSQNLNPSDQFWSSDEEYSSDSNPSDSDSGSSTSAHSQSQPNPRSHSRSQSHYKNRNRHRSYHPKKVSTWTTVAPPGLEQ